MRLISVYALVGEGEGVRYIGVTSRLLEVRLKWHWYDARYGTKTHKCSWMRKCVREGRKITIVELVRVPEEEWPNWERAFISSATNLTNSCEGGKGVVGISLAARIKISLRTRGRKLTEMQKENIRQIRTGSVATAEAKINMSKAALGKKKSALHKANISAAQRGKKFSPERRAILSAAQKHAYAKKKAAQ